MCSATSCERLEKEKEEVRASLADALRRLEEQHQEELAQLEARLQAFYQAEWDKVHRTYQEEADKCRTLMEQQVGLSLSLSLTHLLTHSHSASYHCLVMAPKITHTRSLHLKCPSLLRTCWMVTWLDVKANPPLSCVFLFTRVQS